MTNDVGGATSFISSTASTTTSPLVRDRSSIPSRRQPQPQPRRSPDLEPFAAGSRRGTQQGSRAGRRSLGNNIGDIVEQQITMRSDKAAEREVGAGHYRPSFVSQHSRDRDAKELHDVNAELEARIKFKRRNSGVQLTDLAPGELVPPSLHPSASEGSFVPQKNSLVQIGAAPPQQAQQQNNYRRSFSIDHSNMKTSPLPASRPLDTANQHRKMSLGLSYGPVQTNSYDLASDQLAQAALSHHRRVTASSQGKSNGHLASSNDAAAEGAPAQGDSLEGHWRQQVDAATARVAARRTATADSGYMPSRGGRHEDHSPTSHARLGPAVMAPNTLTLDNWFSAMSTQEEGGGGGGGGPQDPLPHGYPHSPPTRRHSQADAPQGSPVSQDSSSHHSQQQAELRELDEADHGNAEMIAHHPPKSAHVMPPGGNPFSLELATSLKMLIFGATNRSFPSGWTGQSFAFNNLPTLRYGFVQEKAGPCGILAAVQAYLIQALIFGNRLDDTTKAVHPLCPTDKERERALASALVSILHKCSEKMGHIIFVLPSKKQHFSGVGRYKNDGITESLTIYEYSNPRDALAFAQENVSFYCSEGSHAVIAFLYSVLLTRGFANIRDDMDMSDLPLMAAHGYCSQEMVNLLLIGRAVSNTFDNTTVLEGESKSTVFRGVTERSEIGLLSLFEHYQSCVVGENLKSPHFPIWLVCSESHFTVLFSEHRGTEKTSLADRLPIGLNYYDGLYRLDHAILLTVDCTKSRPPDENEELIPPLEHCVRTKWRDALISWNGSEKIL